VQAVLARRNLARFGEAARESDADLFTVQSKEDIPFERTNLPKKSKDQEKLDDINKTLKQQGTGNNAAMVTNIREMLYRRRMERQLAAARGELDMEGHMPPSDDAPPGAAGMGGAGGGGPGGSKFVPPHLRGLGGGVEPPSAGRAMGMRDDTASIRISNLPEETTEDDLRNLCRTFGTVMRVHVAYDKITGEARGFAFVNFMQRSAAEKALEKLDGHRYGHLVLMADWARSRENK